MVAIMLHTLHYQESSNTLFWSQVKSNLNFTYECNIQLILLLCYTKINIPIQNRSLFEQNLHNTSLITWCMANHVTLCTSQCIHTHIHKASLKYITELSSVYVTLIKSDQISFFIYIDVFELNLSLLSNTLFFLCSLIRWCLSQHKLKFWTGMLA